jgi:hypothetical protein
MLHGSRSNRSTGLIAVCRAKRWTDLRRLTNAFRVPLWTCPDPVNSLGLVDDWVGGSHLVFGFPVFDFDVLIDLTRCAWRIERMPQLKLGLKSCENCQLRPSFAVCAGLARPDSSSEDHRSGRCPLSHCRIASSEASVADPESISKEGTEAAQPGPSPVGSGGDTGISSTHPESRGRH